MMPRRVPCVIFRSRSGVTKHVIHGTEWRARRNADLLRPFAGRSGEFHWHEVETLWDRVRARLNGVNSGWQYFGW